jgi:hypothetical protein
MVLTDWDKYHMRAVKLLKQMLKPMYEYHCYSIYFHDYELSQYDSYICKGGFEMSFCQCKPEDIRYVMYNVQFTKDGRYIGLRIFEW